MLSLTRYISWFLYVYIATRCFEVAKICFSAANNILRHYLETKMLLCAEINMNCEYVHIEAFAQSRC